MKKVKILLIMALLCYIFVFAKGGDAYGFGVKKNTNHKQPDIGFYKTIIEENNGIYVGNNNSKKIYITFDCGYENGYTERILDILENHNITATFFITGHYIDSASKLVLRMKEDGHVIGNHSNKHKDITKISEDEIKKEVLELEQKYQKLTNSNIDPFYRPPEGSFDVKSLNVIKRLGYTTLFWSLAYKDWNQENSIDYVVDEISNNIHNGAIILMHTVSESNALALEKVIISLKKQGYVFSSTYELFGNA